MVSSSFEQWHEVQAADLPGQERTNARATWGTGATYAAGQRTCTEKECTT